MSCLIFDNSVLYILFSIKCRFVNDVLHIWESEQDLFGREPVKRTHREIVILALASGKLLFEVIKGVELVYSIKLFIVFAMTAFYFAVVLGCVRLD